MVAERQTLSAQTRHVFDQRIRAFAHCFPGGTPDHSVFIVREPATAWHYSPNPQVSVQDKGGQDASEGDKSGRAEKKGCPVNVTVIKRPAGKKPGSCNIPVPELILLCRLMPDGPFVFQTLAAMDTTFLRSP